MTAPRRSGSSRIPVYGLYRGTRTEAVFDVETNAIEVRTGPLKGERFKSPSGASAAVVQAERPHLHGSTNGWRFWRVASTGEELGTVRRSAIRTTSKKASSAN